MRIRADRCDRLIRRERAVTAFAGGGVGCAGTGVVGKRLAPRLDKLDGKIVYLVDCLFENSDNFMEQLRQWFALHLCSTWYTTPGLRPQAPGHDEPWRLEHNR